MKKYRPKVDKLFYIISIPTEIFVLGGLVLGFFGGVFSAILMVLTFIFVNYFLLSPLFGYIITEEDALFVKFGFIMKRRIPYEKIRAVDMGRGFISYSMMSLKLSFDHLVIKYNRFDEICVSVRENEELLSVIECRKAKST